MSTNARRAAADAESLDLQALKEAFELYTRTAQSMEESYRRLEDRVRTLDDELQEKNRELALTTEYLNSILESMTDGVIAIDNETVITTFNQAACDILGYASHDVTGHSYADIFDAEFTPAHEPRAAELRGSHGPVSVTERTAPINDRNGERIGHVMVFQDITEIVALREQVRRKERLAALGEMAATVAHEIRNPLGGIRGFANLLERDTDPNDPRMRLVQNILAGTKNLDRVVNELLEYTRPIELSLRRVPLAEFIDGALGYVDLEGKRIDIQNRVGPSIRIECDSDKIRQVVINIVLNAVQSIEKSGRITVACEQIDGEVVLSVADTGCGIDEAQLERVFFPFFTTKEKGTGLGLAVAANIVESHGGRLVAESTPGAGATFYIHLPMKD